MTTGSGPSLLGPDLAGWQGQPVTATVVAQPSGPPQPDEPGGRGADFGKSSPVGLLVLLLFFIAVAFLVRSMTKHLKRVPASFDPPGKADQPEEPEEPDEPDAEPRSDSAPGSDGAR